MYQTLKLRAQLILASLPHPAILFVLGTLQVLWAVGNHVYSPSSDINLAVFLFLLIPGYVWVIIWLALFWFSTLEHSLDRKERFDLTSRNFFRAFLDFLIQEGHKLYGRSEAKDFYQQVSDWQRMVIQGLAVGRGVEESKAFHERMETLHPLTQAYREAEKCRSNEPLCRALQGNLEELSALRLALADPKALEENAGPKPKGSPEEAAPVRSDLPQLPSK